MKRWALRHLDALQFALCALVVLGCCIGARCSQMPAQRQPDILETPSWCVDVSALHKNDGVHSTLEYGSLCFSTEHLCLYVKANLDRLGGHADVKEVGECHSY